MLSNNLKRVTLSMKGDQSMALKLDFSFDDKNSTVLSSALKKGNISH